jgi:hypothetical protein
MHVQCGWPLTGPLACGLRGTNHQPRASQLGTASDRGPRWRNPPAARQQAISKIDSRTAAPCRVALAIDRTVCILPRFVRSGIGTMGTA